MQCMPLIWHLGSYQRLVAIIKKGKMLPQRSLWNQRGSVCYLPSLDPSMAWKGRRREFRAVRGLADRDLGRPQAHSVLGHPPADWRCQGAKSHLHLPVAA